jgi:hypothetical protein
MDFRVNLCCENCERKVKKSLQDMHGKSVVFVCMLKKPKLLSWMLCAAKLMKSFVVDVVCFFVLQMWIKCSVTNGTAG